MSGGEREPLLGGASGGGRSFGSQGDGVRGHRSPSPEIQSIETLSSSIRTEMEDSKVKTCVKSCCNVEAAKNKFPIIKWLPKYSFTDAQLDIVAGLTVALTVLPQGLAYATIANLPQQYGLYSAFMGPFVYALLGTSKDITLGPTAIMSLMTAAFATSPVENDPTYALLLTFFCGILQLLLGVFHLGIIVSFISYPVINAFTSAAAITIACGQIKSLLGLTHIPREFMHMIYETAKKIPETKVWDMVMGLICMVILFCLKQLRKKKWKEPAEGETLPIYMKIFRKIIWFMGIGANAIVVITAGGVVAILKKYDQDVISVTGKVPSGLPPISFPAFSAQYGNTTITTGEIFEGIGAGFFIVPLLGLVESIAIGKAFARQNNYRILPNQELIAIGAANIAGSFISAYPVTGSFSRTAVNSQCGVRTPMGGVVTGGIILLSLAFLTPLFEYIPKPALAAVIIMAVIQMVDYEILPKFYKIEKLALVPWTVTFILSFVIGIEYGILAGIGVQLLILLYPIARPKITFQYLDYVVVTFNQAIRFPSVEYLQGKVLKHIDTDRGQKPKSVILDCKHLAAGLDYTTVMGLIQLIADFKRKDVHFAMAGVLPQIIEELENADVKDVLYGDTVEEAIRAIKDAEKAGKFNDELDSITVSNGKMILHTTNNGSSPLPNQVNYGFDTDEDNSVRL